MLNLYSLWPYYIIIKDNDGTHYTVYYLYLYVLCLFAVSGSKLVVIGNVS